MPYIPIEDMPIGQQWYTETADGEVTIIQAGKRHGGIQLSDNGRMTLAMNHNFCRVGKGKVYQVFRTPRVTMLYDDNPVLFQAYSALAALPGLVYVNEHWTPERQREWLEMTPELQMHASWAPHGLIHQDVPVLPFSAVILDRRGEGGFLKFNGPIESQLMAFITPRAYFGRTEEFKKRCKKHIGTNEDGEMWRCHYQAKKSWKAFDKLAVNGIDGIRSGLEETWNSSPELLISYGTLERRVQAAYREGRELRNSIKANDVADGEEGGDVNGNTE